MKNKMKHLIAICAISLSATIYGQGTALDYMQVFSNEYKSIQKDMWDYTSSVSHGKSARKVEKRRLELIQTSASALKTAKSAKAFKGSTMYKDSVVEYLRITNIVLNQDYAKIVDMEEISESSYDAMEAYMTARAQANEKLNEAGKMVDRNQRVFAKENNINLIEGNDALGKKMEIAGEVYDHYEEVYLIFFKSYKQEAYLMDAIAKKDLSAMEQNRSALKATAEEGLGKLDKLKLYKTDKSMVEATRKLLTFYVNEAEKETPKMTDYIMKSENYEKVKKSFEQKAPKARTQTDVANMNKASTDISGAINTYNKANEGLNVNRAKNLDNWNKTAETFTDKHVPKGK
jgi:hypothetical protein